MKRRLEKTIQNNLTKSDLWINEVEKDCYAQNVFLAIRNNMIDFYHKGGRLFCFDSYGFKTHIKYVSVIDETEKVYLSESELAKYKLASKFENNYTRIKENCSNYSGIEDSRVSELYHKHSYLSTNNVVVLDIEVSFKSEDESKKQDRIDILLYKKDSQTLQFVEAKHYSNREIWANKTPKVIGQIKRYESQVLKRKTQILQEYGEYIRIINGIFNISLPVPIDINEKVMLLIFGFDNDQSNGKLKKLITNNPAYEGIKLYSIGNIKKVVTKNLWNAKALKI
jgi:hypothetical protein